MRRDFGAVASVISFIMVIATAGRSYIKLAAESPANWSAWLILLRWCLIARIRKQVLEIDGGKALTVNRAIF